MITGVEDVWEIIKLRYGIDNDDKKDVSLTYIEQVGVIILDYCNIYEIPKKLHFLWAEMVAKLLLADMPNLLPEIGQNASSSGSNIKVGDTSIGESASSGGAGGAFASLQANILRSLLLNYEAQLNHYRRLVW